MHKNRPWYAAPYELIGDGTSIALGRIEWADWDRNGDLLFATAGRLHRLRVPASSLHEAKIVADLTDMKFEPREAPEEAKRWLTKCL